ncbi:MAG: chloramphenicol resistance protein [Lachnospiraceae bacterium]|nr:chloramphenicol resistance protein [Lachnospiraceae bacterium]
MTIIDSVRTYIKTFPGLRDYVEQIARIDLDGLAEDTTCYAIEVTPGNPVLRKYLDGSAVKQFLFVFASRELTAEDVQKVDCYAFYEAFEEWLDAQSRAEILPDLGENREAMDIRALTSGYVFNKEHETSQYQIQCRLKYLERI